MILEQLLDDAGMSKQQLADNIGVSLKTVYAWQASPPQYSIAYLEQYIKASRFTVLAGTLKDAIK